MWHIRYSIRRHHIEGVCAVTYWQGTETEGLGCCAYCNCDTTLSVPIMTSAQLTICSIINRNQHGKIVNRLSCLSAFTGRYFARGLNHSLLCCFTVIKSMPGAVRNPEFSFGTRWCKSSARAVYRVSLQEDSASTKLSRRLPHFW